MDLDVAVAAGWDRDGAFPRGVVDEMAAAGWLCSDVDSGGGGSALELGELCARVGAVCTALRGLITVQGMVGAALARWGTAAQRAAWLPAMARGDVLAGFAATEPAAGSALSAVATSVEPDGDSLVVTGRKVWVTCGEIADVYLVLGVLDGGLTTVLVEADRPGVVREPVRGQLGMRAARIAHVALDRVRVPVSNRVAPAGFGLSHVVATALDHGRFTVAWGCAGMARACLDDAVAHARRRTRGGVGDHQLVRAMLARASVATESAFALCREAARTRGEVGAVVGAVIAKYAAATAAASVSRDAVQVLGSAGCDPASRAGRFFRDAKVMQIIEGSDEVSELHIADHLLRGAR